MKYLPLYYKWIESGKLPSPGLCACFGKIDLFQLMYPSAHTWDDFYYWGYDGSEPSLNASFEVADKRAFTFTELRQNIVLLLAAMNNEL